MRKKKDSPHLPDMTDWTRQQIAEFWDTHDSADYWDEIVPEQIIFRHPKQETIAMALDKKDMKALNAVAKKRRCSPAMLLRQSVKEKLKELE